MRKNDVKVLSEVEHVLHRPGMYVGDTTIGVHDKWVMRDGSIVKESVEIVPAFLKLFDEIVSNSIDEGFRTNFKFANEIKIYVEDNGKISITDNGRGIPVVDIPELGKTQAELAFTNLRAGANFEDANLNFANFDNSNLQGTNAGGTDIFLKKYINKCICYHMI